MSDAPILSIGGRPQGRLDIAVARMAGRLAATLEVLGDHEGAAGFLRGMAAGVGPSTAGDGSSLDLPDGATAEPVDRLVARLAPEAIEVELLVLAAASNHHEGIAAVLRTLHPEGRPWPTVGLASLVLGDRGAVRDALAGGRLVNAGALRVEGDGPHAERSLRLAPLLWEALTGVDDDRWPAGCTVDRRPAPPWGLRGWLDEPPVRAARAAIGRREPVAVVATGDRPGALTARVSALVEAAERTPRPLHADAIDDRLCREVLLLAIARDVVPVLWSAAPPTGPLPAVGLPLPLVVVVPEPPVEAWPRPVVTVPTAPLGRDDHLDVLAAALPTLLPFEHPVGPASLEPTDVAVAAADVTATASLGRHPVTLDALTEEVDDRSTATVPPGAFLVHPRATWSDLVLPEEREAQLREAVARMDAQETVFEDWGFLAGRTGRRGLRLLLAGPPGTGKTLAAEVIASALGRDLLVVDLSRIVSKWIGETEKNLAAAFEAAERGGAVLFFDEADALFGRRTEVGDARDRYANLETAYLLARLERFDGVVILATNLRQNLDAAFSRRIEFIVPFDPPDAANREELWRRHLPGDVPLSPSVDVRRLAMLYELPGALIRNAALAAAFLAASEPDGPEPIALGHVLHALRREYQKAGQAFPGAPAGVHGIEHRRTTWPT